MKAMTFNNLVDKPDSAYPWQERREIVLNMIKAESPDILCIQEALQSQKEFLRMKLPEYEAYGIGRDDGRLSGEQTVIFHKASVLSEAGKGVFGLSEPPDIAGSVGWDAKRPGTVTWKLLQTKAGERFDVLNTHFDHKGETANIRSPSV